MRVSMRTNKSMRSSLLTSMRMSAITSTRSGGAGGARGKVPEVVPRVQIPLFLRGWRVLAGGAQQSAFVP